MKRNEEIYAACRHLHDLIAAEAESGNANIGVLLLCGECDPTDIRASLSCALSGGNSAPIVAGLASEMKRCSGIYRAVRMALAIVDDEKAKQD